MSDIHKHGLYLCSWEWLYLGTRVPRGLPNEIFSRHPGLLILFEHIYCDANALEGEFNAHSQLRWTNSGLFCKLAEREILQPLNMKAHLTYAAELLRLGTKVQSPSAFQEMFVSADDALMASWKLQLLEAFLGGHGLHAYDFSLANPAKDLPPVLLRIASTLPPVQVSEFIFVKRISELSSDRIGLFEDLQRFEAAHLAVLRRGGMDHQGDYLPILQKRERDYEMIDEELSDGIGSRLAQILVARNRFGDRGGWDDVRRYLELAASPVLGERPIVTRLLDSIATKFHQAAEDLTLRDRATGWWRIGMALVQVVGLDRVAALVNLGEEAHRHQNALKEPITFFRGSVRQSGIPAERRGKGDSQ